MNKTTLIILTFVTFTSGQVCAQTLMSRGAKVNNALDQYTQTQNNKRTNPYQQAWDQYYEDNQQKDQTRAVHSALNQFEDKEQYIQSVKNADQIIAKNHNISYKQFPEYGYSRYEHKTFGSKQEQESFITSVQKFLDVGREEDSIRIQSVLERGLSEKLPRGSFSMATGWRKDEIDWNIAGNLDGEAPSVLAEYKWPEVNTWVSSVEAGVVLADKFVVDTAFAYGQTQDGFNEVAEYDGENRTRMATLTETQSDEGYSYDGSVGLGLLVDLKRNKNFKSFDSFYMKMLGGYSYHTQYLSMTDGNETFNAYEAADGAYDGLDSTYEMRWQGPWMGLELRGTEDKLSSMARLKYHYFDYYGEGDLNLQPDFQHPKSFDHNAQGTGLSVDLGVGYRLTPSWDVNLVWSMKDWQIQNGTDRLYLNDGSVLDTRLNEVNLLSQSLMLGSKYDF